MKRKVRLQGILHISQTPHRSGSSVKEPSLKVPFMESLAVMPHHYSPPPFIYQTPRYTSPPPTYQVLLGWKGAELPLSGDFLNISSSVPSDGAPPEAPSTEPLQREMLYPHSLLHPSLKVPGR